jgi:F420-dependent oxidoreductase-like protein
VRLDLMIEGQEDVSWPDWLALAQACEREGIGTLFRSDHYLSVSGFHERGSLDAWGTITGLAALTTALRFGTMVSPATFRHPSILAKAVVTADHVSGGRVELGLGTGWLEAEHEAYGFDFPPLGVRGDRLEEQLQIVRGEWGAGPFDFDGEHYRVAGLDALPKPVQQPHPPVILGGHGGRRSLALAARYADEYNTVYKMPAELAEIRRGLDEACAAVGREPLPLSLMTGWLVAEDSAALVDRAAELAAWQGEEVDGEAFLAARPESWIVGTAEAAQAELRQLADVGVSRVLCQHLLHRDLGALALIGSLGD